MLHPNPQTTNSIRRRKKKKKKQSCNIYEHPHLAQIKCTHPKQTLDD
jgi:hypothetical protein